MVLRIETPAGVILHTGDWKIDPEPLIGEKINSNRLKEIGNEGVLAMICDSTNVFSMGKAGSELDVRKSLLNIMGSLKKELSWLLLHQMLHDGNSFLLCRKNWQTNIFSWKINA